MAVRFALAAMAVLTVACAAAAQDMPLTQVLIEGEDWELLSDGHRFTEGPAVDRDGNVFFSDVPAGRIHRVDLEGAVSVFAENTGRVSGLMFGPDGRLYGCARGRKQIVAYSPDGSVESVADVSDCNDLVVGRNGAIWFTDPSAREVWYLSPDRRSKRRVADGFRPNGIILWPGQGTLVVTDSDQPVLWAFRVTATGDLEFPERYYGPLQVPSGVERPGSDGMTVDRDNRLYVATHVGIQMFDPTGRLGGTIARPQRRFVSNVCFGGRGFRYLYATCSDRVYRRRVKPAGAVWFAEP